MSDDPQPPPSGRFYPNADDDWRHADYDPTGPGWIVMAVIALVVMTALTGAALSIYEAARFAITGRCGL